MGGGQNTSKNLVIPEISPFLIFDSNLDSCLQSPESLKLSLFEIQSRISKIYIYLYFISILLVSLSAILVLQKLNLKKRNLFIQNSRNEIRLAFSREVHDGLAQDLAALKINIRKGDFDKVSYFADQAFNESRFLIENLQSEFSGDFIKNVGEMLSSFEINFNIKTSFFCGSEKVKFLPQNYSLSLFRILNEALSNVARHSKATLVKVKIVDVHGGLRLIVSDNGGGKNNFDRLNHQENFKNQKHHFGLENIKERAKEMNGEAKINFENEDGGTTVAVTIQDFVR